MNNQLQTDISMESIADLWLPMNKSRCCHVKRTNLKFGEYLNLLKKKKNTSMLSKHIVVL